MFETVLLFPFSFFFNDFKQLIVRGRKFYLLNEFYSKNDAFRKKQSKLNFIQFVSTLIRYDKIESRTLNLFVEENLIAKYKLIVHFDVDFHLISHQYYSLLIE